MFNKPPPAPNMKLVRDQAPSSAKPGLRPSWPLKNFEREKRERDRIACEEAETKWRADFKPHAVIHTERTSPSQITLCGLSGGPERWLVIKLDPAQSPRTIANECIGTNDQRESGMPFRPMDNGSVPDRSSHLAWSSEDVEHHPADDDEQEH